ncbi:MAG: PAS domain S-box protein [Desulfomonilaceae bacterium]
MQDHEKSQDQLIDELKELRRRVAELESAELAIEKTPKENDENTLLELPPLISQDHPIETEELTNVLNIPQIQSLMDDFYKLTNIGIAILDLKGNILVASGWQDICTKFHRVHPDTLKNCIESDLHLTENVNKGEYRIYKCKNNMWDMVTPIVIGERHVGNLYLGQFFFECEVPDLEMFAAQAQRYGFDKNEYLAALNMLQRPSRGKVHTAMTFYSKFASMIGELSYSNLKLTKTLHESKRLAETLRESEERFHTVFETANDAIFLMDNAKFIECNAKTLQMFGCLKEKDIVGHTLMEFSPEKQPDGLDSKKTALKFINAASNSNPQTFYWKHCRKDGSLFDAEVSINALTLKGKTYLQGIVRNITEQKRAEEALRESEQKFRAVFQNGHVVMLIIDPDTGMLMDASPAASSFYGYSLEDLKKKRIFDLNVASPEVIVERMQETKSRQLVYHDFQHRLAGGELRDVQVCSGPIVVDERPLLFSVILDITDRKRAEEELRISEDKFGKAFLLSPNAMSISRLVDGMFVSVNEGFKEIYGDTEEQFIGKTALELNLWDNPEDRKRMIKCLKAQGKVRNVEASFRVKNGDIRHGLLSAAIILLNGVEHILNVTMDITDFRRVEEELHHSESRLSRAELVAGFGHWEIDLSTKRVTTSVGARKIYGLGQQVEWAGDYIEKVPLPEYRSSLHEALFALIKDGAPYDIEFEIRRANDDQIIDIHSIAHYDAEKNSVFGTIHDITNLRRAEECHRLLFAAIEQAADAIIITDAKGIIQYVNPAQEILSGHSRNELLGQTPGIFKSDKHDDNFYRNLWETIESGKVWSGKFINKKKDGTEYHEDVSISPVYNKTGKLTNFVAVKHDVTKQLELQDQLLQAQKMEAIGTLAGGFAHDFNNKLQVIGGYVELILFNEDLPETVKSGLGAIKQTVDSSAQLIKGMMVFSRKTPVEHQPMELNKLVAQASSMLTRSIPKMIEIDLSLADDLWVINAAPNQIDQILMNLAINARDAMPDGGKLTIQTQNTVLHDEFCRSHPNTKPGRFVLLSVTDSGRGMDHETVRRIFEPFFTTKESGKGTGLGLAVVYGIVEQHSARITCQSEPSVGTTFRIYFPAIEGVPQEQYSEKKKPPRGRGETILFVDDEPQITKLTSVMLTKANYRVITASNGKEALELYKKHWGEIKLVILDLMMPEMGGEECLRGLLEVDSKIGVLVASGALTEGMSADLKEAGARGLIKKPFDITLLLDKIRKIIDEC